MQPQRSRPTVLLAEGDAGLRAELQEKLASRRSLTLGGTAASLPELMELMDSLWPDVVLLGRDLAGVSQAAAVTRVRRVRPQVPILLLTMTGSTHAGLAEALRAGGWVALRYDCTALQIASAVFRALAGEWGPQDPRASEFRAPLLTAREIAVLTVLGSGRTDAEASAELGITERTYLTHIRHLCTKLDVPDRTALMERVLALRARFVLDGAEPPEMPGPPAGPPT